MSNVSEDIKTSCKSLTMNYVAVSRKKVSFYLGTRRKKQLYFYG